MKLPRSQDTRSIPIDPSSDIQDMDIENDGAGVSRGGADDQMPTVGGRANECAFTDRVSRDGSSNV
ncbi:hypothetical protein GCM10027068_31820 [Prescottella soli]